MQTRTLPSWRLAGIEIRPDASVLVLIALVAWAFHGVFRAEQGPVVALLLAAIGALLVVATTLAHELGHALEARSRGMHVDAITLLLFGGVTEMHADGQDARDELAVAAVGPWVSLVCAAAFGLLATFADDLVPAAAAPAVGQLAGVLGWWNLLLAAFNLIPGAPLDGGRVLRALLWMLLGDRLRALRISVRAGQLLGVVLLVLGAATLVRGGARASLVAAAFALSGVFLIRAAAAELRHAELHAALEGWYVAELLARVPASSHPAGEELPEVTPEDDLHTLIEA
ncbi:MAG: site-2 protease family protein, partial [Nitriliruptoraceae bacterium]